MNRAQVASLLEELRKSPDRSTLYRKLVKVRTEVINTEVGIQHVCSLDGIKLLVSLLSKPHEKVLEVVLSILGNCCMKKDCAKQVRWEMIFILLNQSILGKGNLISDDVGLCPEYFIGF